MAPEVSTSKGKAPAQDKPEPPIAQSRMEVDTEDDDDDNGNDERIKTLKRKLGGAERYAREQQTIIN